MSFFLFLHAHEMYLTSQLADAVVSNSMRGEDLLKIPLQLSGKFILKQSCHQLKKFKIIQFRTAKIFVVLNLANGTVLD